MPGLWRTASRTASRHQTPTIRPRPWVRTCGTTCSGELVGDDTMGRHSIHVRIHQRAGGFVSPCMRSRGVLMWHGFWSLMGQLVCNAASAGTTFRH
eukprot:4600383-Pyramimonas_sp.AAC.1